MPGKLKVKIISARNLPVMDRASDLTDAFVEIKFGNTILKTEVYKKSLNPHWNSDWFRFEVDDEDLQDEPLQIRVLDHDTYTAHDAIGKVYIDLNPLLNENKISTLSGWYPIYDTMHGIQGQLLIGVKIDHFSDFNKFRKSSCGVKFFCTSGIPEGYRIASLQGFIEELVVNDDPEYQWIDKIRSMRASNEARQIQFSKLSGQLQRKIGLKVLEMGGNAVIGYRQCFDLEGESGVVVRAIGTCVKLKRLSSSHHLSSPRTSISPNPEYSFSHDQNAASATISPFTFNQSSTAVQSTHYTHKPTISISANNRRLSESDVETPVKVPLTISQTPMTSTSRPSAPFYRPILHQENIEMLEYSFFTMKSFPIGFIEHIGGVVSATSVKLLDKINDPDEPRTRDVWWTELRTEIRSHMRAMGCHAVLGYSERTSIHEELIILSSSGTSALVNLDKLTNNNNKLQLDLDKQIDLDKSLNKSLIQSMDYDKIALKHGNKVLSEMDKHGKESKLDMDFKHGINQRRSRNQIISSVIPETAPVLSPQSTFFMGDNHFIKSQSLKDQNHREMHRVRGDIEINDILINKKIDTINNSKLETIVNKKKIDLNLMNEIAFENDINLNDNIMKHSDDIEKLKEINTNGTQNIQYEFDNFDTNLFLLKDSKLNQKQSSGCSESNQNNELCQTNNSKKIVIKQPSLKESSRIKDLSAGISVIIDNKILTRHNLTEGVNINNNNESNNDNENNYKNYRKYRESTRNSKESNNKYENVFKEADDPELDRHVITTECSMCHIPYQEKALPFPVNLSKCLICKQGKVPDILFSTIEPPLELPIIGKGCFLQARICRQKKESRGESNAKEVSDSLPFVEYELHKQLVNKLKVKGMNSLFCLNIQIVVGESQLVAIATATGVYVEGLPQPGMPQIISKTDSHQSDLNVQKIRLQMQDTIKKNKDVYKLNDIAATKITTQSIQESNDDVSSIFDKCLNETFVFEIDDEEDAQVVLMMFENPFMEGFEVCNTERMPGVENYACNLQMFSKMWRGTLKTISNTSLDQIFQNIFKSLMFKFRFMTPCALCHLDFDLDISREDEIQISVTGICVGIGTSGDMYKIDSINSGRNSLSTLISQTPSSRPTENDFERASELEINSPMTENNSSTNLNQQQQQISAQQNMLQLNKTFKSLNSQSNNLLNFFECTSHQNSPQNLQSKTQTPPSSLSSVSHYNKLYTSQNVQKAPFYSYSNSLQNSHLAHHYQNLKTDSKNSMLTMAALSKPLRILRVKHHSGKTVPFGVQLTPLSWIPRAKIQTYIGHLNFFVIRESTSIREEGGLNCFMHSFIAEVMAICRAHVTALGGNALVSFQLVECILQSNLHKNQSQCLVNVFGDVVSVTYECESATVSNTSLNNLISLNKIDH